MKELESKINTVRDYAESFINVNFLPNCKRESLNVVTNDIEDNDGFTLSMSFVIPGVAEEINLELTMKQGEKEDECYLAVFHDNPEQDILLLPGLKDKLLKHPSLQYPDYDDGSDWHYYIHKQISTEEATTAYIAAALTVQSAL